MSSFLPGEIGNVHRCERGKEIMREAVELLENPTANTQRQTRKL
jgi:hypothetical protein